MPFLLLLDECVSHSLVQPLCLAGHDAVHTLTRGWSGLGDWQVFTYALAESCIVVTLNVLDYVALAARTEVHAGLWLLRAVPARNLSRPAQRAAILATIAHVEAAGIDMVNTALWVNVAQDGSIQFTAERVPP